MDDVYLLKFEKGLVARYKATYKQYNFKLGDIVLSDFAVEPTGNSEKLYPTSLHVGAMWLEVRLRSTMSGGQARWIGDREKLGSVLNRARYEPVFRGFVSKFVWYPPSDAISRRDGMSLDQRILEYVGLGGEKKKALDDEVTEYIHSADYDIVQMGSAVTNWVAKLATSKEIPQPEIIETNNPRRGHLRDLMTHLMRNSLKAEKIEKIFQGNLMLLKLDCNYDMECFGNLLYPVRRTVFNHYFSTGGVIAQRNTEYLVYMDEDGFVLSVGHEPVELTGGLYIAEHPVPVKQKAD
jgi:hypothetical protein